MSSGQGKIGIGPNKPIRGKDTLSGTEPENTLQVVTDEGKKEEKVAPDDKKDATPAAEAAQNELVLFRHKDVNTLLTDGYVYQTQNNSTICDIVAMYLKGQKILYTEAKTVCEVRLHYLMLPAIVITAGAAILSMILKENQNGAMIVSVLNSVNTFLLTLINYLKLDARAEAHRTAAYKFDKLQSYMEFNSGRILFDQKASEGLVEILKKVENDVREIKETNQFVLPEKIRYTYSKLYSTNVFAEVKKIMISEAIHIEALKNAMNSILEIEEYAKKSGIQDETYKKTIAELEKNRKAEINNVLLLRNKYLEIDKKYEEELEKHRTSIHRRLDCCGWLKS